MSDQNPAPEAPKQTVGSAPPSETIGSAPPPAPPGVPVPPPGVPPPGAPVPGEPMPTRKSPLPRVLLSAAIGFVVLILALVGAVAWFGRDTSVQAAAGSCLADLPEIQPGQEVEANDAKVVDCASDEAIYKVEGRLDDKTLEEATSEDICQAFEPAAMVRYYSIRSGGKGHVLCLSVISR